jgi:ribonuclease P protein component
MPKPFSFSREERIKSKKTMDTLFRTGKAFFIYPYKVHYLLAPATAPEDEPLQAGFSVPKRLHRRANRRNRLKRLGREHYRLRKTALKDALQHAGLTLRCMWLYQAKEEMDYAALAAPMEKCLKRLLQLATGAGAKPPEDKGE